MDSKNKLNEEQRNQFLPIMKALYKVMETSTPAPGDVNTLLVLTRDLTKDLPGGGSGLPVIARFNIDNMGLLPEGDVIVDIEGVPYINTQFGEFYLAHVIEQPNFGILNPQYLQRNFVYLIICLIKSRTNSQQRHL